MAKCMISSMTSHLFTKLILDLEQVIVLGYAFTPSRSTHFDLFYIDYDEVGNGRIFRFTKATSERVDVVRRVKALQAIAQGCSFTEAGKSSGLSRKGVSQLVERFNKLGLAVLGIAKGRGRKPTYDAQARAQVVQEVQRQPDRQNDQTATWSLKLLERSLRRAGLSSIGATTIGRILHEDGLSFQRDRTWCDTGTALRVRKDGVYRVHDPQVQRKKELIELVYKVAEACGLPLWWKARSWSLSDQTTTWGFMATARQSLAATA